jgi:hypothetical protein
MHAFAHSPLEHEVWDYWNCTAKSHDFLGFHHEVYEAEAKHWENVYANFQPTGLGATSYLKRADGKLGVGEEAGKGDENEKVWEERVRGLTMGRAALI